MIKVIFTFVSLPGTPYHPLTRLMPFDNNASIEVCFSCGNFEFFNNVLHQGLENIDRHIKLELYREKEFILLCLKKTHQR